MSDVRLLCGENGPIAYLSKISRVGLLVVVLVNQVGL